MEIEQIKEYQVFKDFVKAVYNKNNITNAPKGHQKIRVHFVFDVKHCGKFKARLEADVVEFGAYHLQFSFFNMSTGWGLRFVL